MKDSHKFWDDSANLFREYCLQRLAPEHLERFPQALSEVEKVMTERLISIGDPDGFPRNSSYNFETMGNIPACQSNDSLPGRSRPGALTKGCL